MAAVGVLCFWASRRRARSYAAFQTRALRADGHIVELSGEDGDMPTVEFADEFGRKYRVEGRTNSGSGLGAKMVVFYPKNKPRDARLASDMANSSLVLVFLAVVFVLGGASMMLSAALGGG